MRRTLFSIALTLLAGSVAAHAAPPGPTPLRAEVVAKGLSNPVGVTVGPNGQLFVAEGGTGRSAARIVRASRDKSEPVAAFPAALTGLVWHDDRMYASFVGGMAEVTPQGALHVVVTDLPSRGDHPNYAPVISADGQIYFGQGSVTNAGVVGPDNRWLSEQPRLHDIPCRDLLLRGPNFSTTRPSSATTGAFVPYGQATARGQTVNGRLPCTGAIMRVRPDGSNLELVAWGMRDPRAVAFGPDGKLYALVRGMEDRGSRPVASDRDYLFRVEPGLWYGWPDFAGGRPLTEPGFQKASMPAPLLLLSAPNTPPRPLASFAKELGATGLTFPGWLQGDAIILFSGTPRSPGRIARVNLAGGTTTPLLPTGAEGPTHPTAVTTGPRGDLYVTDLGEFDGLEPKPGAGALWRVTTEVPRSTQSQTHWNWALCGLVLSIAGTRLILTRKNEESQE